MSLGSRNSSGKRPNLDKFLTLSLSQNECRSFSNHPNDLRTLHDSPGQLKQNPTMTIPFTQTSRTITPQRQRNLVSSFVLVAWKPTQLTAQHAKLQSMQTPANVVDQSPLIQPSPKSARHCLLNGCCGLNSVESWNLKKNVGLPKY